ncbi:MAG: TlpA disulfide reductase family protein [Saprospiraceae bacterium]|nr:TlpA disulfide reductase family protein [Saprospiraceae bacterium]
MNAFFALASSAVLALLTFSNCSRAQSPLSGTIHMGDAWKPVVYLVRPDHYRQIASAYEGSIVDSAAIDADGRFAFKPSGWLQARGLYFLYLPEKRSRFPHAIAGPPHRENVVALVLAPGEAVELEAYADFLTFSCVFKQANAETRRLADLRDARKPVFEEFMALAPDSLQQWSTYGSLETQQEVHRRLDAVLDTLTDPFALFLGLRWRVRDNEFRDQPEFYLNLLKRLPPDHPWTAELAAFLQPEKLPLLTGEKLPPFALPTLNGDTLRWENLSGKLILLDFWASWCAPCRKENRETLRPLYDAYHDKGFEILGVSLDADRDAWSKALLRDGAVWPQVCDLEGDASPVRQSLRFAYIPSNYLLDAEGRLLARNLHGEALVGFVRDFLNK